MMASSLATLSSVQDVDHGVSSSSVSLLGGTSSGGGGGGGGRAGGRHQPGAISLLDQGSIGDFNTSSVVGDHAQPDVMAMKKRYATAAAQSAAAAIDATLAMPIMSTQSLSSLSMIDGGSSSSGPQSRDSPSAADLHASTVRGFRSFGDSLVSGDSFAGVPPRLPKQQRRRRTRPRPTDLHKSPYHDNPAPAGYSGSFGSDSLFSSKPSTTTTTMRASRSMGSLNTASRQGRRRRRARTATTASASTSNHLNMSRRSVASAGSGRRRTHTRNRQRGDKLQDASTTAVLHADAAYPGARAMPVTRFAFNLRQAIEMAEDGVNQAVAEAQSASEAAVAAASVLHSAEDTLYSETKAMHEATQEGVADYLADIATQNEMIAELKAERALLKIDVDERIPYWMVRWKALTDWMVGIAHTVGWRDDAKVYVSEMVDMFLADEKAEAVPEMQRILLNINAWSPSEFQRMMGEVYERAHKLELARPSTFTSAVEKLRECDARLDAARAKLRALSRANVQGALWEKSQTQAVKNLASTEMLAATSAGASSRYTGSATAAAALGGAGSPGSTGRHLHIGDPAAAATSPTRVLAGSVAGSVDHFVRVSDRRLAPHEIKSSLHRFLVYCASSGAWKDAFHTYGSMLQCRVVPDLTTFQHMIAACKHATPPNSAAAVAVLAEMRRRHVPISASTFNRVIDACRLSGSWRRGLTVFQAMMEAGCKPTTVTYDTLVEACAHASREDAPDVYSAMKYSGVPEFIAYSASMKAIHENTQEHRNRRAARKQYASAAEAANAAITMRPFNGNAQPTNAFEDSASGGGAQVSFGDTTYASEEAEEVEEDNEMQVARMKRSHALVTQPAGSLQPVLDEQLSLAAAAFGGVPAEALASTTSVTWADLAATDGSAGGGGGGGGDDALGQSLKSAAKLSMRPHQTSLSNTIGSVKRLPKTQRVKTPPKKPDRRYRKTRQRTAAIGATTFVRPSVRVAEVAQETARAKEEASSNAGRHPMAGASMSRPPSSQRMFKY